MKKLKKFVLALFTLFVVGLFSTSLASACTGRYWPMESYYGNGEVILGQGTYQDLKEYRNEVGYDIMPWIQNEAEFDAIQQMYQRTNDYRMNQRAGRSYSSGMYSMRGGCC
jgi:hypothetical protein